MTGTSGCFGTQPKTETIDNVAEVSEAVDAIIGTPEASEPDNGPASAPDMAASMLVVQYVRRVRLLTWAVAIIAAILVIKEIER